MNFKDFYTRVSEEREFSMSANTDLEKRIAQRLGIHKNKEKAFGRFFMFPALTFAVILCVIIFSSPSVDAAKHTAESFFLNYSALGISQNPFMFLAGISLLGIFSALSISFWLILRYVTKKSLKITLLLGVLAITSLPLLGFFMNASSYTQEGTVAEVHCEKNTLTLKNTNEQKNIQFPINGFEESPMDIFQKNGEKMGVWSKSTFCDSENSTPFLAMIKNIPFTVTINRLGYMISWKAHETLSTLGSVVKEEDITVSTLLWSGEDINHRGHSDISIEGENIHATITLDDPSLSPKIDRLTEKSVIILLKTETQCSNKVYVIDRETGVMDPMDHEGCFITSTDDGALYFEDKDGINAYHIWDKTLVIPKNDLSLTVSFAEVSPDSSKIAFALWDGMMENPKGRIVLYDTKNQTTEILSEKYWNSMYWNADNISLKVSTDIDEQLLIVK